MSEDEKLVVQRIKNKLGDADEWRTPKGYPQSLALCAIDSVFSLNAHYSSTMKVVDRYTTVRIAEGQDPSVDGLAELVETIDRHGGPKVSAAELFNNFSIAPGTAKH